MKNGIHIKSGGVELLPAIEELWKKLKSHHSVLDQRFPDTGSIDFESRVTELKAKRTTYLVELLSLPDSSSFVGYCVSTINERAVGEIDSIYIDEDQRGKGYGKELIERSLKWMDDHHALAKQVCVLMANKGAIDLYESFGFTAHLYEMMIPIEKPHK